MSSLEFIDVESARAAKGPLLVVAGNLPSPWSEAAKGIFHAKGLPMRVVGYPRIDEAFRTWTGALNVPVLLTDDEPPRSGWAEILAFAERSGGSVSLVPAEPEARVRHHGLAHELCGKDGFGWCTRLVMIDGGLTSGGARSFPLAEADCPQMLPRVRPAFTYLVEQIGGDIPPALIEHRAYLLKTHLPWPCVLRAEPASAA